MDKFLYNLMDNMTEQDLEKFTDTLDSIAKASEISQKQKEKILISAERKAGFEMKEKNVKIRKSSKRIIAFAAAAAMLAAGGTAAAIGMKFANRDSLVRNFGYSTTDILEDEGAAANITTQNEHFKITADSVISNGISLDVYFTMTALSDEAKAKLAENQMYSPRFDLSYKDGEEIESGGYCWGIFSSEEQLTEDTKYFQLTLSLDEIDQSCKLVANFFGSDTFGNDDDYLFEGLSITFSPEENLGTVEFADENGNTMKMNLVSISFEINADDIKLPVAEDEHDYKSLYISYTDTSGETSEPSRLFGFQTLNDENGKKTFNVQYEKMLEPSNYTAVTITDINGEVIARYTPVS